MRYLQRDGNGKVIGHYANPQAYAQEEVPDDHPDIQAFKAERDERRLKAFDEEGIAAILRRLKALEQRSINR